MSARERRTTCSGKVTRLIAPVVFFPSRPMPMLWTSAAKPMPRAGSGVRFMKAWQIASR